MIKVKRSKDSLNLECWKKLKWGDLATLEYGKGFRNYSSEGKYPVYGTNGRIGYCDQYLSSGPGVIIGRKGAYRGVHYSQEPFFVIDTAFFLKLKINNIDLKFVYYALLMQDINRLDSGSAIPSTTRESFYNLDVFLPPLSEQRAIAKILGDLDAKIELNHQMNKTLESMAQAIFKQWFVDFKFPGHEKTKFINGLPEGWRDKTIFECGQVICGKTPPTADKGNYGTDICFITIPDMRGNSFVIKTERHISFKGASMQKNKELPPYSICISCIATPGLVSMTSAVSHTNQQINSIIPNKDISPFFVYCAMLNKSEDIKTMGLGGTATLNLNTGDFSRIKIATPTDFIMKEFHATVAPLFEAVLINAKENLHLRSIRDSFLPRLMSGKIKIER